MKKAWKRGIPGKGVRLTDDIVADRYPKEVFTKFEKGTNRFRGELTAEDVFSGRSVRR